MDSPCCICSSPLTARWCWRWCWSSWKWLARDCFHLTNAASTSSKLPVPTAKANLVIRCRGSSQLGHEDCRLIHSGKMSWTKAAESTRMVAESRLLMLLCLLQLRSQQGVQGPSGIPQAISQAILHATRVHLHLLQHCNYLFVSAVNPELNRRNRPPKWLALTVCSRHWSGVFNRPRALELPASKPSY